MIGEKVIGPYGEDEQPIPVGEDAGIPCADYKVRIENVLKGDSNFEDGGTLVLRIFGHLSGQGDVITLAGVQLPEPGSHYMLALGRNPNGTYGSGSEGLIFVDGEIGFSTELTDEKFVEAVRQEVARQGA